MLVEFERLSAQLGSGSADILNRVMSKDNIAIGAILLHKATKTPLFVGNAHLHWDPEYKDVKVVQAAMLVHEINKFVAVDDKKRMPILLGGDFNSEPNSGVFKMLAEGEVGLDHPDLIDREYAKFDEVVSVLCGACCPTHSPTSQWVFSALYADTRLTPPPRSTCLHRFPGWFQSRPQAAECVQRGVAVHQLHGRLQGHHRLYLLFDGWACARKSAGTNSRRCHGHIRRLPQPTLSL
jgi:hypothetical protein